MLASRVASAIVPGNSPLSRRTRREGAPEISAVRAVAPDRKVAGGVADVIEALQPEGGNQAICLCLSLQIDPVLRSKDFRRILRSNWLPSPRSDDLPR